MELRHLRYFRAVAELGSFSAAARQLHVAQSSVSEQVADLEQELGGALLDRTGRAVTLTVLGTVFLQEAEKTLESAERAVEVSRSWMRGESGTLSIGFFSTTKTNSLGNDGILYGGGGHFGGWNLLLHQFLAAGAVTIYSFVATAIIALVVNLFLKNRVSEEAEDEGLDTAIHGESAYEFGPIGGSIGGLGAPIGTPKEKVDA